MQKLNSLFLLLIVVVVSMSCTSQELTMKEAYAFLKEYREVKSKEQAETGILITSKIESYWVPFYSIFGPPEGKETEYYIYADDFKIISIEKMGVHVYDEENNKKGRTYFVRIVESFKGKYLSGKIDASNAEEYTSTFWMAITDKGLKIYGEPNMSGYCILEKDLPILMKRLQ